MKIERWAIEVIPTFRSLRRSGRCVGCPPKYDTINIPTAIKYVYWTLKDAIFVWEEISDDIGTFSHDTLFVKILCFRWWFNRPGKSFQIDDKQHCRWKSVKDGEMLKEYHGEPEFSKDEERFRKPSL